METLSVKYHRKKKHVNQVNLSPAEPGYVLSLQTV